MIRGCPQLLWKDQPALWSDFWLILELFLVENALMDVEGLEILQHLLYFPGMSPPVVLAGFDSLSNQVENKPDIWVIPLGLPNLLLESSPPCWLDLPSLTRCPG